MRSTIHELRRLTTGPLPVRAAFALAGPFVPGVAGTVRLADRLVWEGTFGSRFEDRDHAMEVFGRHNEAVRRRVPPERLLVFDVREGWAPLCDFLGVEAPGGPFPRLNGARQMRRRLLGLVALSAVLPALAALAVLAASPRRCSSSDAPRGRGTIDAPPEVRDRRRRAVLRLSRKGRMDDTRLTARFAAATQDAPFRQRRSR